MNGRRAGVAEQDDHWFSKSDALAEELAHASKRLTARAGVAHVEIYHRISRTIRGTALRDEPVIALRTGCEEGTALRVWGARETDVRFVATSGGAVETIERAVDRVLSDEDSGRAAPSDRCDREDPLVDHDGDAEVLPGPDRLMAWLDAARVVLSPVGEPARLWFEVASTCETWASGGRTLGSRRRARGWALLDPGPGVAGSPGPRILAARSWNDLDSRDWVRTELDRPTGELPRTEPSSGRVGVLLSPEAAATLVLALVRAVPPDGVTVEVGQGFRVRDAPDEPAALFGGLFDDLGFPTRPTLVADGCRLLDFLSGPGHYRRPSFRDVPVCQPANLIVEPPDGEAPPNCLRVHRLTIHPLAPDRWVLEVDGIWWSEGAPRGAVSPGFIAAAPRELLARCVAGVGQPFGSHRGVRTPALLFDGLPVTS